MRLQKIADILEFGGMDAGDISYMKARGEITDHGWGICCVDEVAAVIATKKDAGCLKRMATINRHIKELMRELEQLEADPGPDVDAISESIYPAWYTPPNKDYLLWERMCAGSHVSESGCWVCDGQAAKYPTVRVPRNCSVPTGSQYLHRVSYTLFCGDIPDGLVVDHKCCNTKCWNPAHLQAITNGENVLRGDGPAAKNARKTHCKAGHPLAAVDNSGRRRCLVCRKKGKTSKV